MPPMEFTDRYQALGIPYPDPTTMCHGHCEGIGRYPHQAGRPQESQYERDEVARIIAVSGESADGWYFVICPTCNGTGKRSAN